MGGRKTKAKQTETTEGAAEAAHNMQVDVLGCIRNTQVPLHAAFLPIFEAVVNGIHSTQDKYGDEVGRLGVVNVHIHRVPQKSVPGVGRPPVVGIESFSIVDNGHGFNDVNMESFETAYSTVKADRGGKGLGRFSWLVLCRQAHIASTFENSDGNRIERSFWFRPSQQGIEAYNEKGAPNGKPSTTTVELEGVRDRYHEVLRKGPEVIAEKLFEHCFDYLVVGQCPQIRLIDEGADGTSTIDVNHKLDELTIVEPVEVEIGDHRLQLRYVQQPYRTDRHHQAHLCADQRVVTSFPLSHVSELGAGSISGEEDQPVVQHVFVSGDVLDASVDTTRTRLDLAEDESLLARSGSLDFQTLRRAIGEHVNEHFSEFLLERRVENYGRIENHIRSEAPQYGPLLRQKRARLECLNWTDDKQRLDESLYRVHQELEAEVYSRQADVERKLTAEETQLEEIADELERVIFETNEVGQVSLVKYVIKRRAVLQLLSKLASRYEGQALEEQIHRTVFPMKKTGDEVALGEHNLWLVDDTLSFYDFLTSDLPMADNDGSPSDSARRPDILAVKTGDPHSHVAIVEFKRPERSDSDPAQQLKEYAQLLRKGGKVDINNIPLPPIDLSVRIDGFAVVTLTESMRDKLSLSDLHPVPLEERWHGHHQNLNMTLEVLDFRAFIRRAEQRNKAFFVKLGLS